MILQSIPLGVGIGLYGLASFWSVRSLTRPVAMKPRPVVVSLAAGSIILLALLLMRGIAASRLPVFGRFEALTVYSLVVTGAFLLISLRHRMRALSALLVPYATLLLLVGATASGQEVRVDVPFDTFWLGLHVSAAFSGYALCTLAGVLGLAYVIQDNNLKRKRLGLLFERLP